MNSSEDTTSTDNQWSDNNWIVNLSSKTLKTDQIDLLKLGFKHGIVNHQVSSFELFAQVENIVTNVSKNQVTQNVCRTKLTNQIKRFKTLNKKNEVYKNCQKTIKELKKEKSIMVINADKGNKTVIIDRSEYDEKMTKYVMNEIMFEKQQKDPTTTISKSLIELLTELKNEKKIDKKFFEKSLPKKDSKAPGIFSQTKLHKNDRPLRPIVNNKTGPCINVAKQISLILNNLRPLVPSSIKKSVEFVKKIREFSPQGNFYMYSIDIVDMFNSLPLEMVLQAIRYFAEMGGDMISLETDTILKLVKFCINNSYFKYDKAFFKQLGGLTMGSPLSPILAEITMGYFELMNIKHPNLICWYRYVDDTFLLWSGTKRQFDVWLNKLNKINTNIQFTSEIEENGKLNFLDVTVYKQTNNLNTKIFRKNTYSGRYLNYKSAHSKGTKKGIAINMFRRAYLICNKQDDLEEEIKQIYHILELNNYPPKLIKSCHYSSQINKNKESTQDNKKWISLFFIPGLTECIMNTVKKQNFRFTTKPETTIGKLYYNNNSNVIKPKEEKTGVIYAIPCECGEWYVGETKRQLKVRLNEHKRFTADKYKYDPDLKYKSAIAEHFQKTGHQIQWEKTKIIDYEKQDNVRKLKESFYIKYYSASINVSSGVSFPPQWYYLFVNDVKSKLNSPDLLY